MHFQIVHNYNYIKLARICLYKFVYLNVKCIILYINIINTIILQIFDIQQEDEYAVPDLVNDPREVLPSPTDDNKHLLLSPTAPPRNKARQKGKGSCQLKRSSR